MEELNILVTERRLRIFRGSKEVLDKSSQVPGRIQKSSPEYERWNRLREIALLEWKTYCIEKINKIIKEE